MNTTSLKDIYLVSHKRAPVLENEIASLKRQGDYGFPDDVCDFLFKFDPGEYCCCLYLFKPEDLLHGQTSCREFWSGSFYYDREKSALSQQEVLHTTRIGRTLDGDEVVCQPTGRAVYYVLPRHSDVILWIGGSLREAFDWFSSAGVRSAAKQFKWFCTFKDRCRLHLVKNEVVNHIDALSLVDEVFGVNHAALDNGGDFSIFFSKRISGFVHVWENNLDFHYDSDFDSIVCHLAEEMFLSSGFRSVEHRCP
jgi:hypothetical protein